MSVGLPEPFLARMNRMLGDEEFPAFVATYQEARHYGLRVNALKVDAERYRALSPFNLESVPWSKEGFYYKRGERPAKHPHYYAGLYYIQEPSAMAPAELAGVVPGDRVLDLCAAPGGKSTQLAAKLQGRGLLVANDNQPERVKALVKNLALAGVRNAIVTCAAPEQLAARLPGYFDKIVIDAPCSGEGMFRKDEEMASFWSEQAVARCAKMQDDILASAVRLLAPGGRIVYSTCTFAPVENEGSIARFLARHPDFTVVSAQAGDLFAPGRPEWLESSVAPDEQAGQAVSRTYRLWPHKLRGEGHFVAVLQHDGKKEHAQPELRSKKTAGDKPIGALQLSIWRDFMRDQLTIELTGQWISYGDHVYWTDWPQPDLTGIQVARPGWFVGTCKNNRFVPSQALAMGLQMSDARRSLMLAAGSDEAIHYLKGETLQIPAERIVRTSADTSVKGYCLVGVDGFPLGWGKWQDGILKNEYPAGWRWNA